MKFTFEVKSQKGIEFALQKVEELKKKYPEATFHIKIME